MAELQLDGDSAAHRVRVRNLSACGMMAEGDLRVLAGARVTVNLKNLQPVEGSVAWVHQQRFGIAFAEEIDPKAPRSPVGSDDATSRFVRSSSISSRVFQSDPKRVRNI